MGGRSKIGRRSEEELKEVLRTSGCRITPQRSAILRYIASTDTHPSARRVFEEARKTYPGLSLATVYNTLETLGRMGLVKVMDFQATDNRHETNLYPHINLICKICGAIYDFDADVSLHLDRVEKKLGFEVQGYRMEYYGVCARCKALAKESFQKQTSDV